MITKEELIELNEIEDGTVFFEPHEVFGKGIVGISEDRQHIVYDYQKTAEALAEEYEAEWNETHSKEDEEEKPDFMLDAYEWLDYNTMRTIPYLDKNYAPIVIFPLVVG